MSIRSADTIETSSEAGKRCRSEDNQLPEDTVIEAKRLHFLDAQQLIIKEECDETQPSRERAGNGHENGVTLPSDIKIELEDCETETDNRGRVSILDDSEGESSISSSSSGSAATKEPIGDTLDDSADNEESEPPVTEVIVTPTELKKIQHMYRFLAQQRYIVQKYKRVENHPKFPSFRLLSAFFDDEKEHFKCPKCRRTIMKLLYFEHHLMEHDKLTCHCHATFANAKLLEHHKQMHDH